MEKISFEEFYSVFTRSNCSNQLKFWMVSEACLKLVDEKDLKAKNIKTIYDDFLRNSAPLKVRASSLTVQRMKMGIYFACMTDLAPSLPTAQMEVYPLLFVNLSSDLGSMCGLFAHHFTKLQSRSTCAEKENLEKRASDLRINCSPSLPRHGITKVGTVSAYKKHDQISEMFLTKVCHQLTKVQKERDQWQEKARKEACRHGKSQDAISSLEWYDYTRFAQNYIDT